MIPPVRLILLAAFISLFTSAAYAQKSCPVPPPSPYKHSAEIVTVYDKAARRMKVVLQHPHSLSRSGDPVYLYAEFFFQDPRLQARPPLSVTFISVSKDALYRNARTLDIMLDGQNLPITSPVQYSSKKGAKDTVIESAKVTLSFEQLLALLRSKKVEARLGPTQLVFTKNHMESLREIASLMLPTSRMRR